MERVLTSQHYGPHRVDVIELADDEGVSGYQIVIDDTIVTDQPLGALPSQDDLVHIYDRWLRR